MESQTLQNTYVAFENGQWVTKTETISAQAPPGLLLVRNAYSTCNPIDGIVHDGSREEGNRLGREGCGTIISVGEGADTGLLGKNIAFLSASAWAQYQTLDPKDEDTHILILEEGTDLSTAAAAMINPLTVIGQLDIIRKKGTKAFVADAAASSLNKMLIQLCSQEDGDIQSINVVRKEEQAKNLRE